MRVLLVEDQPVWCDALITLLQSRTTHIEAVTATNVRDAQHSLAGSDYQLVIAGFSTADVCCVAGIEGIVSNAGQAPVITLDGRANEANSRRAMAAGARAYISKTSTRELIDAAIGLVLAGGQYFPSVTPGAEALEPRSWASRLSTRQTQVLGLMLEGMGNRQIGENLGLALPTVKLHVTAVLRAAGVRTRTEVVLKAHRLRESVPA
jgi:DNA-binding NarL/FixJ family response regulator